MKIANIFNFLKIFMETYITSSDCYCCRRRAIPKCNDIRRRTRGPPDRFDDRDGTEFEKKSWLPMIYKNNKNKKTQRRKLTWIVYSTMKTSAVSIAQYLLRTLLAVRNRYTYLILLSRVIELLLVLRRRRYAFLWPKPFFRSNLQRLQSAVEIWENFSWRT